MWFSLTGNYLAMLTSCKGQPLVPYPSLYKSSTLFGSIRRLLMLQHVLAWSPQILLWALISPRVMSGQVWYYLSQQLFWFAALLCTQLMLILVIGTRSFHRRSLHHIGDEPNPYEQAISIIGRTLSSFDEDNLIPCFGFGDGNFLIKKIKHPILSIILQINETVCDKIIAASTHDQEVFSFFPDERFCNGFEEVLERYRELVPQLRLAGFT